MFMNGKTKSPLSTRYVAEMVRCPVCRERPADPCHFLSEEGIRPARDYEMYYHHERLREAEYLLNSYALRAIRNDIRSHARYLVMSLWELVVAIASRPRNRTGQ